MEKKKKVVKEALSVKRIDETLFVYLGVQLTINNAPLLQQKLSDYQDMNIEKIVFDATDLVYLTSAGVRVIMFIHLKMTGKPKIEFVNCAKEIQRTLQLVGMTSLITSRARPTAVATRRRSMARPPSTPIPR
jgi:anti-anti-sigma factor